MDTDEQDRAVAQGDREILVRICGEAGVPADIVERMIAAENRVYGMGRRHGIWEVLDTLLIEATEGNEAEGEVIQ